MSSTMFPGSPESSHPLDAGPGPAGRPVRRASRSTDDRMIGGVAGGLAEHLGLDPLHVRIAFVVAGFVGGFGLVFYAGLWMILPADRHLDQASPGSRGGHPAGQAARPGLPAHRRRPASSRSAPSRSGVLFLVHGWLGGSFLFWPLLLGVLGLAVLWWQADEAQRERWIDSTGRVDIVRAVVGSGGAASYARLAAGRRAARRRAGASSPCRPGGSGWPATCCSPASWAWSGSR